MLYLLSQKGRVRHAQAKKLYQEVLRQSRNPVFYTSYSIPDTIEGRFEMVSLHGGLIVNRLCRPDMGLEGRKLAQAFFDVMFKNIDWAIRENGVGDLAVPRRIKKMMSEFKGRAIAYDEAAKDDKNGSIVHVLLRNVYGQESSRPSQDTIELMADYIHTSVITLDKSSLSDLYQGNIRFAPLQNLNSYNGTINNAPQAA